MKWSEEKVNQLKVLAYDGKSNAEIAKHLGVRQKYHAIVADTGYESPDNYLYLEGNNQTSFIKPVNYEVQKTKKV